MYFHIFKGRKHDMPPFHGYCFYEMNISGHLHYNQYMENVNEFWKILDRVYVNQWITWAKHIFNI